MAFGPHGCRCLEIHGVEERRCDAPSQKPCMLEAFLLAHPTNGETTQMLRPYGTDTGVEQALLVDANSQYRRSQLEGMMFLSATLPQRPCHPSSKKAVAFEMLHRMLARGMGYRFILICWLQFMMDI